MYCSQSVEKNLCHYEKQYYMWDCITIELKYKLGHLDNKCRFRNLNKDPFKKNHFNF